MNELKELFEKSKKLSDSYSSSHKIKNDLKNIETDNSEVNEIINRVIIDVEKMQELLSLDLKSYHENILFPFWNKYLSELSNKT